ncbi:MAG: flagellar basal body-associated FliL family protein [Neomegalonema sp.]|nr:flagellar basal body-associated FliL family protein [Neomegalonema sp.]
MLRILLAVLLVIIGVVAGAGVGFVMKPPAEEAADGAHGEAGKDGGAHAEDGHGGDGAKHGGAKADAHGGDHGGGHGGGHGDYDASEDIAYADIERDEEGKPTSEYVELARRFIVPVHETTEKGRLKKSLVAITFTLEVEPGAADLAAKHEPKIRDVLHRTLINFAATGAFDETANPAVTLKELRRELRKAARSVLGYKIRDVLIGELIKQKG